MYRRLSVLSCCFILSALLAPTAQAIAVDPGEVGSESNGFSWVLDADMGVVDITFTDMKHLECCTGSGVLTFVAFSVQHEGPIVGFSGFFSDEEGEEISGTDFEGATETGAIEVSLPDPIVWHDMHFVGDFGAGDYSLVWAGIAGAEKPIVGVWTVPEPGIALLLVMGLAGFAAIGRKRAA
jgi:hypothetical protein